MKDKKQELVESIDMLISWLNYQKDYIKIIDKFNREQSVCANKLIKEIHNIKIDVSQIINLNLTPRERKSLYNKCYKIDKSIIQDSICICNNDFKLAYSFCIIRYKIKKSGRTTRPSNKKIIDCILQSNYDIDKSLDLLNIKFY